MTATEGSALASDPALGLLDAAPDAMVLVARCGRIALVNQQLEALFGYRADEVVGQSIDIFVPPELRDRHGQHVAAFWEAPGRRQMSGRTDLVAVTRDGQRLPVEISLSPVEHDGQQFVLMSVRDVSKRLNLEAALAQNEAELRHLTTNFISLLENTADFVYFKDRDHRFTAVSKSFAELTRHGHWRELIGKTDFDVFPEDQARRYFAAERKMVESGSAIAGLEEPYRDHDGEQRWVISHKKPLLNSSGEIIGLFGISKDVTSLKRLAAELAVARDSAVEEVAQRKQVFMDAADPILIEDLSGTITDLNLEAERVYGWSREELIGKPIETIVPVERHERTAAFRQLCLDGEEVRNVEGRRSSRDGKDYSVLVTMSRLDNEAGEPVAIATIAKDISALKEAEAQLQEYSRNLEDRVAERTRELQAAKDLAEKAAAAKSAFLATMSHELRTPINGVNGMLELLTLTDLDAEQRDMLRTIRDSADTLLAVVGDVLDFSKIEAGELHLESVPLDLPILVEGVQRVMSVTAVHKSLALVVDIEAGIQPIVRGDPVRLRQILFNLIGNAIKFTDDGSVTLRVRLLGVEDGRQQIAIQVADTGIGVPADKLDKLFKPFSQADDATTRRRGGTGLGLAICQRLVGMMGGTISMESQVGKGTVVTAIVALETVIDPVEKLRAAASILAEGEIGKEGLYRQAPTIADAERSGRLILVAEDHPTNRKVIMQQLAQLGFAAEAVANGVEALEAWRSGRFGLLLTDCHMPDMDGYMLARRIREIEATQGGHVPIIAITANAMAGEDAQCRAAGMDDYMIKPVTMHVIAKKVSRWIQPGIEADVGAPEPGTPNRPIDVDVLERTVGADPSVVRALLDSYRQSSNTDFAALRDAIAKRQANLVVEAAHRIKGAARMIGANELSERAWDVESAGRSKNWPEIEAAAATLHRAFQRVADHFETP